MRTDRLILASVLVMLAPSAPAALYKWVDEKGRVQYSDKPPAESSKGGVEMSNRGVVKKKLDTAPTPEEKKAQEEAAARRRAEQQEALAQRRADNALLQSFTSVQEIDMKRDRELQAIDAMVSNLKGQERTLADRLNEDRRRADAQAKKGKPSGDGLKEDIARGEAEVKVVRDEIQRRNQEAADTRVKYEALKKRYIELRQPGSAEITPASVTAPPTPPAQRPSKK
jgi:hypothetical protein